MALNIINPRSKHQRGTSLIELMIAILVLTVGILALAAAIPFAIGMNHGNRQQSNSTVIDQMVLQKIASVPAGSTSTTITDCANNTFTVSNIGTPSGSGGNLQQSGQVDFSQGQGNVGAGYYMNYVACGPATYDVRWNIQTPTNNVKLVTVSAKLQGALTMPVTLRGMIGPGN